MAPRLSLRAGIQVVAAVAVFVRLTAAWSSAADGSPASAVVLAVAGALLMVIVVAAVAGRTVGVRTGADWLLLAVGTAVVLVEQRSALLVTGRRYPSDEGRLVQHAIAAIRALHDPYSARYPDVARFAGNTPLFGGGGAERFGYPPLMAELGAGLGSIWSPLGTAGVVGALALLAIAVVGMLAVPRAWRGLAILVVLGFSPLTIYAVNGHPAVLAAALLCVACAGWSKIGRGGRLRTIGVAQGVCLGLAAAAQQLAWFFALGLLVAVWLVRRGESSDRSAALLVVRLAAAATTAFVLVNLPFIVASPGSWASGLLSLIGLDHPVASGQGLVMLNVVLRGQGGAFEFYSYASVLMELGVLLMIGIGFRRLAPLVPVLTVLVFAVSIRSQGEYFLLFTPVWLVWLAGSDPVAIGSSRPLGADRRTERLIGHGRRRAVIAGAALLPAIACVVVAVASPGPLRLTVAAVRLNGGGRVAQLQVRVTNVSGQPVAPHFYLDPRSHLRSPWRIVSGPRLLRPGQRATLALQPALLGPEKPAPHLRVWALSDDPKTMSSAALVIPRTVPASPGGSP